MDLASGLKMMVARTLHRYQVVRVVRRRHRHQDVKILQTRSQVQAVKVPQMLEMPEKLLRKDWGGGADGGG